MKIISKIMFCIASVLVASFGLANNARIPIRDPLSSDRVYYVRADGNDENLGLIDDSEGAFLTVQRAIDTVSGDLDLGHYNVTIQIADGTYGSVVLKPYLGAGTVTINGNSALPENVLLTTDVSNAVSAINTFGSHWVLSNISVSTSGSGGNAVSVSYGTLVLENIRFLDAVSNHIGSQNNAYVQVRGDYSIAGDAVRHLFAQQGGIIFVSPYSGTMTVSLVGTRTFSGGFARIHSGAILRSFSHHVSYSGTAIGQRYYVDMNGVIVTLNGGSNYFPGNSAGVAASGGEYN